MIASGIWKVESGGMKTKWLILVGAVVFSVVLIAQQGQRNSTDNAVIVSKLSEVVKIRERLADNYKAMVANGRAAGGELVEVELAEARVALAHEVWDKAKIIQELKGLVAAHEPRVKFFKAHSKDRVPIGESERAEVALLEAEVLLLRAQR